MPLDSPKIASPGVTHNSRTIPRRAPARDEIGAATVGFVQKGGRKKADLLLVDVGEGEMVVKDFAGKSAPTRLLGRVQVRREVRAYRWLGRMPGIPAFIGEVDGLALAMEKVEGERVSEAENARERGEEILGKLRVVIDRLQAKGVVHNDLRGRKNLMLRPDGELVLLDLAGAIVLRPGSLAHRLFFRRVAITDEAAYLKWKEFLTPGRFTEEEAEFVRRHRILRRMWPFNRKWRRSKEARP